MLQDPWNSFHVLKNGSLRAAYGVCFSGYPLHLPKRNLLRAHAQMLPPDVAVVVLHRAVINVGAPGGIVQTLPHAIRRGLVHEGRRDGKLPVVVKPPAKFL